MIIVEYDKNWIIQFQEIKEILENNLSKIIKIEHIGSTSIIGMCAKPIIDIDIIIDSNDDFVYVKNELELIGYYHNGDQGILGREVFKRGNSNENMILDKIKHHLYVCQKDNEELNKHLLFRDYLNKNNEARMEYINIKKEIINKYGDKDREKYVFAKENDYKWFFDKILKGRIQEASATKT
jgi:GrpB-like predicted nucleotidyltransferase (UPF0157 family)